MIGLLQLVALGVAAWLAVVALRPTPADCGLPGCEARHRSTTR